MVGLESVGASDAYCAARLECLGSEQPDDGGAVRFRLEKTRIIASRPLMKDADLYAIRFVD